MIGQTGQLPKLSNYLARENLCRWGCRRVGTPAQRSPAVARQRWALGRSPLGAHKCPNSSRRLEAHGLPSRSRSATSQKVRCARPPSILLHFLELLQPVGQLRVLRFDFQGRLDDQNSIVAPPLRRQQSGVAKHHFGTGGTQRQSLPEGIVSLLEHPLLFGRTFGIGDPPGVKPADGRAEL